MAVFWTVEQVWKCYLRRRFRACSVSEAFAHWRRVPVSVACGLDPMRRNAPDTEISNDVVNFYFPDQQSHIELLVEENSISLDALDDVVAPDNEIVTAKRYLAMLIDPPENLSLDSSRVAMFVRVHFVQAGHHYYREQQYEIALRCFLNGLRVEAPSARSGPAYRNVANCLAELGHTNASAFYFVLAGESAANSNDVRSDGSSFELGGLAWESVSGSERAIGLGTAYREYNSTVCFQEARRQYSNHDQTRDASRCRVLALDASSRWEANLISRVFQQVVKSGWLYFESPLYAARTVALVCLIFAGLFAVTGIVPTAGRDGQPSDNAREKTPQSEEIPAIDYVYFSAITMSTLGYGDYRPENTVSKILAGIEAFLGIVLVAMFLVCIQRRYIG